MECVAWRGRDTRLLLLLKLKLLKLLRLLRLLLRLLRLLLGWRRLRRRLLESGTLGSHGLGLLSLECFRPSPASPFATGRAREG